MGSFGNYLEDELLDHVFMKGDYTSPTNIYVALSTADPTDDGSGLSEPSGGSYARESTAGGDWNAASGGSISNATDIVFTEATANWGTITHIALYDAASAGNMLAHGALDASKTVSTGDTFKIPAGDLTITLD